MDNKDLFEALTALEKERGISADYMLSKIEKAIQTACKNTYGGNEDITILMNKDRDDFEVRLNKEVVEEVENPNYQISLNDAMKIEPSIGLGQKIGIALDPKQFGRIAVQTSRSIIRQGIRDGEKNQMIREFESRKEELVTATIERVDPKSGNATIKIGKAEAVLPHSEQVGNEELHEGDHIKVYVVKVADENGKGPRVTISRTHPDFVKRLFETEVPEIYDGTVQIKSVSREAGSRTKLAVFSKDKEVDPVGACIGAKGVRVSTIVNELGGEKIDIIEYDEDPAKFIAAALSPANVISVVPAADGSKVCRVTVPDSQLSLAIGNRGQNARLAAKLTGWKIDIRPESGFFGEEEEEEPKKPVKEPKKEEKPVDLPEPVLKKEKEEKKEEQPKTVVSDNKDKYDYEDVITETPEELEEIIEE